ncbi:MAG: DUF3820 family protein [Chlamydiota bacterium]|nr:DUF3820 family protein [Chlamydiota bacterium]
MRHFESTPFVCFDCEATGLDTENDRIVEIASCRFTLREIIEEREDLVHPGVPIPAESTAIHHITDAMVEKAPPLRDLLPKYLEMIGESIIIGHGIAFDIALLSKGAERAGIPHTLDRNRTIDTLRLARLYGGSPSNSLSVLAHHFNIPDEGAHRARQDVAMNIALFDHLTRSFSSLKQIFERLEKPIALPKMPLGKHKGRAFWEIPLPYLKWASHQDFDGDLLFSIRRELKHRREGKGFHQASNPFQGL